MSGTAYVITTVTAPAPGSRLTTLPAVEDELNLDTLTARDRRVLSRTIDRASTFIANHCGRTFGVQTYETTISRDKRPGDLQFWNNREFIRLNQPLISPVTSVTENGVALVENTDFVADYDKGKLYRLDSDGNPQVWPFWQIVIVYQAGWRLPGWTTNVGANLPADLEDACIRMVRARWDARGRDPYLKDRNIPGVIQQQWWVDAGTKGNLPPDIAELLEEKYRVPVTAAA